MASFVVDLEDGVSGPAQKAAGGVEGLASKFDGMGGKVSGLLGKLTGLAEGGLSKLSEKGILSADTANLLDTKLAGLTDTLSVVAPYADMAAAAIGWLAGKLKDAMALAIQLTQEKDQLRSVFDVLTGGMGGQLLDELEDLASTLPFTADKLNEWAKSLLAAGIQGDALKTSIQAIASATAIMGEKGGQAAQTLIKRFAMMAEAGQQVKLDRRILAQLAEAGVSIGDLARALGVPAEKLAGMSLNAKKLGDAMQQALIQKGVGPLQKMGNTWATITAKLREGFEDAFEDLGDIVGPFMAEIQSLASEFFAGSVAANDWKAGIKVALTEAFGVATKFVNFMHKGFLEVQIAILKVRIALKPVTSALGELGIGSGLASYALIVLKYTVIVLAVLLGLLAVAIFLVALPFLVLAVAVYTVIQAFSYIGSLVSGAIANFDNLKAAAIDAGSSLITGLGNAIMSGSAWVISLVAALAGGIIGAITGPLQIRSPSRVMAKMGMQTTEGLALGLEGGTDRGAAAAAGAGAATIGGAASGVAGAQQAAAAGKGGGLTINVQAGAVVIQGASGDASSLAEEAFAALLERCALQSGLAPEAT